MVTPASAAVANRHAVCNLSFFGSVDHDSISHSQSVITFHPRFRRSRAVLLCLLDVAVNLPIPEVHVRPRRVKRGSCGTHAESSHARKSQFYSEGANHLGLPRKTTRVETEPVTRSMQEITKYPFRLRVSSPYSLHQLPPPTFIEDVRHRVPQNSACEFRFRILVDDCSRRVGL
jgi:hypothetical protein